MTAKKRGRQSKAAAAKARTAKPPFYKAHPNWTAVGFLALVLLLFYYQVLFYNRTLLPPDTLASKSFQPFIKQTLAHGEYPKWNPYIFSGMPSFASLNAAPYVDLLTDFFKIVLWAPAKLLPGGDFLYRLVNYFIFGLFAFFYLRRKGVAPAGAAYAATGLVLLPQVVAYAAFGHGTKLNAVALIPLILLLVEELMRRKTLLLFAATGLAIGLQLLRAHVQISYYTFLLIGFLILWELIWDLVQKKDLKGWLGGAALVVGALMVGFVVSSWLYLSVYEYSHYSIRGGAQGGLSYSYATGWSFSPAEILTFFVPSFFGFGGQTYWGPMPFTDFPMYFGVTVFFLALAGLVLRQDRWTWFLAAVAVLALVVSFGRHLPILYGPMFKFFPFFNKFRVPVMIQILMEISVLLLAGLGLHELLQLGRERDAGRLARLRLLAYVFGGIVAVIFLFVLLGKGAITGWMSASGKVVSRAVQEQAYKMAARDALKMVALVGVLLALVFAYVNRKLSATWLVVGAFVLLLVDLWPVSHRLLNPQPKASEADYFRADRAVTFLKQQKELFRIFPVADRRPPNWYAYHFLQNIYGYHAAKLKIYQTLLEQTRIADRAPTGLPLFLTRFYQVGQRNGRPVLLRASPESVNKPLAHLHDMVLDMLNVRYLLSLYPFADSTYRPVLAGQRPGELNVIENTDVLPRAFFVDSVAAFQDDQALLAQLRSPGFDPRRVALLSGKPGGPVERGARGSAKVTSFGPHRVELEATVDKPACLVVSEVYYPAGWKATVDDKPVQIHRADYVLRAIFLGPGSHKVRFIFDPWTFKVGLWLTIVSVVLLIGLIVLGWRRERAAA